MRNNRPIMIIDSSEDDCLTVSKALKEIKVHNEVVIVQDGLAALDYLTNNTKVNPCLIFLEINIPIMSGDEFLKERVNHPDLMAIPVIVLTANKDQDMKYECFKHNIAGYMYKPSQYTQMVKIIRAIDKYWTYSEVTFRN